MHRTSPPTLATYIEVCTRYGEESAILSQAVLHCTRSAPEETRELASWYPRGRFSAFSVTNDHRQFRDVAEALRARGRDGKGRLLVDAVRQELEGKA